MVLWARRVFLHAQEKYLGESRKLPVNQRVEYGRQVIDTVFEKYNSQQLLQNGGVMNLNYLIKVLTGCLFGPEFEVGNDLA